DFDQPLEAVTFVLGRQHEVREHLTGADLHTGSLFIPNVYSDFVFPLQLCLQKPDDAIVLELLSDRPHQNRTQVASGEPAMVTHIDAPSIDLCQRTYPCGLTHIPFTFIMMR